MTMMVLSNPRVAALITIAAILLLGTAIAYLIMRVSYQRILRRKINTLTDAALTARDETIGILEAENITLREQKGHLKAKIARVSIFLGKAVTEVGI